MGEMNDGKRFNRNLLDGISLDLPLNRHCQVRLAVVEFKEEPSGLMSPADIGSERVKGNDWVSIQIGNESGHVSFFVDDTETISKMINLLEFSRDLLLERRERSIDQAEARMVAGSRDAERS